jgi:hypothetical protein
MLTYFAKWNNGSCQRKVKKSNNSGTPEDITCIGKKVLSQRVRITLISSSRVTTVAAGAHRAFFDELTVRI